MSNCRICLSAACVLLACSPTVIAQDAPVAAPTPTIWRFMGIPQGFQKIRDVTVNRRGNFPRLERRPPIKRIGDPANLFSDNSAIKAAAEVKQAEDLKAQKIKAIKYLASIGCGCYDKEGKITNALMDAMDDCTPDVREAAIEAVEEAAEGGQCQKCGSTSCCSEELTKKLSDIAYERDDDGCPIEPNADVRAAAARVLRICCPGGPPSGPIEEELPTPPEEPDDTVVPGESRGEDSGVQGESVDIDAAADDKLPLDDDADDQPEVLPPVPADDLILFRSTSHRSVEPTLGAEKMIGGMKVQPVTLTPVTFEDVVPANKSLQSQSRSQPTTRDQPLSASDTRPGGRRARMSAEVVAVNHRTGDVQLRSRSNHSITDGASAVVYHEFLTGDRLVSHLIVRGSNGRVAIASVTDPSTLKLIHIGDRVVCH